LAKRLEEGKTERLAMASPVFRTNSLRSINGNYFTSVNKTENENSQIIRTEIVQTVE
jgi:hypothetical protein